MDRLKAAFELYKNATRVYDDKLKKDVLFINGKPETDEQAKEIDAKAMVWSIESAKIYTKAVSFAHWQNKEDENVAFKGILYSHNEVKRNRLANLIASAPPNYTLNWFSIDGSDPTLSLDQLKQLSMLYQECVFEATAKAKAHERNIDAFIDLKEIQDYDFTE